MANGPSVGTTTPGDPFRPSPAGGDYSTQALINRMQAALGPTMRQGAQAVRQAAAAAGRRKGVFGAADIARQATQPFAAQLGQAAARAGVAGEQLGAQMERQLRDITLAREQAEIRRQLEQQRIEELIAQRQQQAQMQLLPYTGFTQELLQSAGYPGTPREPFGPRMDLRTFQRSLEDVQRMGMMPGLPFEQSGRMPGGGLTAQQNLMLSRMYPGSSRAYRLQQAMNLGLIGGPIQPGQFRR